VSRSVLFVHDGPIYQDTLSDRYYGLHYNDQLVERYRYLADSVSFLMRVNPIDPSETGGYGRIDAADFQVIKIPNFKSIRSFFINRSAAKSIIRDAVARHDVIVVRLPSSAGVIAYNEAIRQKKPILVEVVACVFDALWNYDWRGKLLAHYKYFNYRRLMRNVPFALYVTEHFLQSRYPTNGKSESCSDVDLIPRREENLQSRLDKIRHYKPNQPLVLGTIAALDVPYKGQVDVIKALGILKKRGMLFKYRLVGQGNPTALLKVVKQNDVEDIVQIVGALPHAEIFSFLKDIDVYIHPSKLEGLPRAMIEAMSLACPCLGSNVGGIPELIESKCTFNPGDVDAVVSKLRDLSASWLFEQSTNSFFASHKYQKAILDGRRRVFYNLFLDNINNNSFIINT
jgi:glycosyltransferase involved in cell wall biosynthesis